jgi:hypothetical protein
MKPSNVGVRWRTAPKKPTAAEPSLRDKLSKNFLEAFESDFRTNGATVIQKLREESASKYAEIAAKLVTAIEPKSEEPRDMRSMAIRLLKDVGANEYEITEDMIEQAIKRNEEFIDQLLAIKAAAEGQMQ